jgi:hypothetical protein
MPGFQLEGAVVAALVAAVASLAVAVVTYLSTRSNQRDLERLRDRLAEGKAERDAVRDYRYEAHKRLYHECAPLMFQLLEQAEGALNRIQNLAGSAAGGRLQPGRTWLSRVYYRHSTLHRFLAPLATLKLLQRRLTLLDLSLDPYLHCRYYLAKQLYMSFADDFDLARVPGARLDYDPHADDAERHKLVRPEVYWQQGVPIGILDNAVQALIVTDQDGLARVMTYGEFEAACRDEKSAVGPAIDRIDYLFQEFHPRTRPVLWRVLVAQAHLYRALLRMSSGEPLDRQLAEAAEYPADERKNFDWRQREDEVADRDVLEAPFTTAAAYLRPHLKLILTKVTA